MRNTILIAGEKEISRTTLKRVFFHDYDILEASDGQQCLDLIEQNARKIACVLLEIQLPVKHGFQVLTELRESGRLEQFPVVMVSEFMEEKLESLGFDLGASDYIVTKPFVTSTVQKRVNNVVELYRQQERMNEAVAKQTQELLAQNEEQKKSMASAMDVMSVLVDLRETNTDRRMKRMQKYTEAIAEVVAQERPEIFPESNIDLLVKAAGLHDIGKIVLPDDILAKHDHLTPEERDIMNAHTIRGAEIADEIFSLEDQELLNICHNVCLYHHERYDGKGYPDGLKQEQIPIEAQIVSVVDAFDCLTSGDAGGTPCDAAEASRRISEGECGAFSKFILGCFFEVRDRFSQIAGEQTA